MDEDAENSLDKARIHAVVSNIHNTSNFRANKQTGAGPKTNILPETIIFRLETFFN